MVEKVGLDQIISRNIPTPLPSTLRVLRQAVRHNSNGPSPDVCSDPMTDDHQPPEAVVTDGDSIGLSSSPTSPSARTSVDADAVITVLGSDVGVQEQPNTYRMHSDTEVLSVGSDTSTLSTSTDGIESDLPGPGRALDRFYHESGRQLDRLVGYVIAKRRRRANFSQSNPKDTEGNESASLSMKDTLSSTATTSDRPGPGRALDKVYQGTGRELERILGNIADRAGFGPVAVKRSIDTAIESNYNALLEVRGVDLSSQEYEWIKLPGTEGHVLKACKKLLRYTQ